MNFGVLSFFLPLRRRETNATLSNSEIHFKPLEVCWFGLLHVFFYSAQHRLSRLTWKCVMYRNDNFSWNNLWRDEVNESMSGHLHSIINIAFLCWCSSRGTNFYAQYMKEYFPIKYNHSFTISLEGNITLSGLYLVF